MQIRNKSSIKLLIQSPRKVFCYYNIPPKIQKVFRNSYGKNAWKNSKPIIKVYKINNGVPREIKKINIDDNTDNCYIKLLEDDVDIYAKVGRVLANGEFIGLAKSNIIFTPREKISNNKSVYYIDVSKNNTEEFITSSNLIDKENKLDLIFTKDIHQTDYFDKYYRNASKVYENTSSR